MPNIRKAQEQKKKITPFRLTEPIIKPTLVLPYGKDRVGKVLVHTTILMLKPSG